MRITAPSLFSLAIAGACGPGDKDTGFSDGTSPGSTTAGTASGSTDGPTPTDGTTATDGPASTASGDASETAGDDTTSGTTDATTGTTATTGEPGCDAGPFFAREAVLEAILQDLAAQDMVVQPFTRYVSLVHAHNAGLCGADLELRRLAVAKLINALSQAPKVVAPVAIDGGDGLLLRVDLRDYGWDDPAVASDMQMFPDTWEMVARTSPYALEHFGPTALAIAEMAGTAQAVVQADALVAFASRPPLYYDALAVPDTLGGLSQLLAVDLDAAVAEEKLSDGDLVARAAFHESSVTDFNRVMERHQLAQAATRSLWRTHDFASQIGFGNPFIHPFDFEPDVSEVLFSLPNGLHGYMIVDPAGARLDEMPVDIEQDGAAPDVIVRPGVSCMGCHGAGIIPASDDLRWELDNGMTEANFDENDKEGIRNLHPTREDMDVLLMADRDAYAAALAVAGVTLGAEEPVSTVAFRFDEDVDAVRAAAELWVPFDEFQAQIGALSDELAPLVDGTVPREVFSEHYADSVCTLGVGHTAACP